MHFSIFTINLQSNSLSLEYRGHNSVIMVIQEKNKEALFNEEKKPKKFWVSPIFMEKKLKGELHALIQGLKLLGSEYFFKQF